MSSEIATFDLDSAGLVPPYRLGALLSESRTARGLLLEEIVERANGAFSAATLASIERGTTYVTDEQLTWLARLYGLETTSLVPSRSRLVIDTDARRVEVPDTQSATWSRRGGLDEVLVRYLAMVYSMRQVDPGTTVSLRIDDIDVLGQALDEDPISIAGTLQRLMDDPTPEVGIRLNSLRHRVLVPAAGILVALVGAASLVMVQRSDASGEIRFPESTVSPSTTTTEVADAESVPVDVGTAVVQERGADGEPGAVQTR